MKGNSTVEHMGVVESRDGKLVRVGFVSHAACSSCHAKGACSLSEVENKYVEVTTDEDYQDGERVKIMLEQRLGFKALWYGYVFPLIMMLTGLIVTYAVSGRDGLSGLVALAVLAVYYSGLFLFRNALKHQFEFKLRKIQ